MDREKKENNKYNLRADDRHGARVAKDEVGVTVHTH